MAWHTCIGSYAAMGRTGRRARGYLGIEGKNKFREKWGEIQDARGEAASVSFPISPRTPHFPTDWIAAR